MQQAKTALRDAEDGPHLDEECRVDAFPEIVAGAAGYARGTSRRDGLKVFVDIGATTLDVCVGRIHRAKDDDEWSLLAARVSNLGVIEWNERLFDAMLRVNPSIAGELDQRSIRLHPMAGDPVLSKELAESDALAAAKRRFARDVRREAIGAALDDVWRRKDRMWNQRYEGREFPVLLMGGGSQSRHYQDALVQILEDLREEGYFRGGLPLIHMVASIPQASPKSAHRMAVAFGLSFRSLDLGTIRLQHETRDRPVEVTRSKRRPFVDKDHV